MGKLSGMKEICRYVNRSECTTLDWIRNMDMPAKKLGGIWESETGLIDDWRKGLIAEKKPVAKKKMRMSPA